MVVAAPFFHLCANGFARLKRSRLASIVVLSGALVAGAWPATALVATQPRLGTALNFTVLAGSTITNTGPSLIFGNLGLDPGTSVTGFPPGIVTGAQHVHVDAVALQAKTDLVTAYTDAQNSTSTSSLTGQDLGGKNLTPGVYTFSSDAQLTGPLTLSGDGVFIFQVGSALTTASNSVVLLTNGAQACAVYWQIGSSATLGTGTQFQGNLMALSSITMNTGANIITGRALALNAALTLDSNVIIPPSGTCAVAAAASPSPSVDTSPSPSAAISPSPALVVPGTSPTPGVDTPATPAVTVAGPGPTPAVGTPTAPSTPTVGVPNTGHPPPATGFPWWALITALTIGALLSGLRVRTYLRDST